MTVSIILPLLRVQLDDRIDTHDGDAGLDGTLELLDLAHAGLQHACLEGVVDAALREIKAVVAVRLLLGDGLLFFVGVAILHTLGKGVADSELSNELGGVLGGVHGQGLRNHEERLSEFTDGELLAGALLLELARNSVDCRRGIAGKTYHCDGEFFEVDVKGRLNGTATGDDAAALQSSLDGTQRIVD